MPVSSRIIDPPKQTRMTNHRNGFTLIELLVVIAIIGVLSAVVLASLNTARSKGNDAAIESNLAAIQAQAELYYSTNTATPNKYGGNIAATTATYPVAAGTGNMFVADATINSAMNAALKASGAAGKYAIGSAAAPGQSYALAVPLVADSAHAWCIDSSGAAKTISSMTIGGAAMAAACPP